MIFLDNPCCCDYYTFTVHKNTPKLWDKVWEQTPTQAEDQYKLRCEENSIRWQRVEKLIRKRFRSFKKLSVIEIGAGAGTNAALFAKMGADVTILDYSDKALARAKQFFKRLGLRAKYIKADALRPPKNLAGRFDVVMSFGLTEHFAGPERLAINKTHFDLCRQKGMVLISVPNKWNLPYRASKFFAQKLGYWKVGEEYPYDRNELAEICRKLGVADYRFFGDSFISSLQMVNPIWIGQKILRRKPKPNITGICKEWGTPLDQYISYALVLCAFKG